MVGPVGSCHRESCELTWDHNSMHVVYAQLEWSGPPFKFVVATCDCTVCFGLYFSEDISRNVGYHRHSTGSGRPATAYHAFQVSLYSITTLASSGSPHSGELSYLLST
jgi:hypothetical protein